MGDKLVLSPKEELGYEGIVIRLEEVQGGFIERGKQLLQKRRLFWFAGREQGVLIYGLSYFIYLKT
jgi:hypothetical protein